tara:strand:- start:426 stop:1256 length:831 start_codon:yes stop_codon:yes gene_type:complete
MSKISEQGYLFAHSGVLEKDQLEKCLKDATLFLSENFDTTFKKTEIEVNVVKNKEGKKFGHSYCWVGDEEVFNALIGKNFDGSPRYEEVEDEDWVEPEQDYEEAVEEAGGSWAMMAEIGDRYIRPMKRIILEPLVTLPAIKYTENQLEEINNESDFGFVEIFPIMLTEKIGKINTIFSDNIPDWITEKILLKRFSKFNQDDIVYYEKKSKKKFTYPIVKIKKKRDQRGVKNFCTITFSHLHKNTASFLINLVKRIEIESGDKKAMLFFSQSKSRNN